MKIKYFVLLLAVSLFTNISFAQEIDMKVTITAPNLKIADGKVIEQLKTSIIEFFNNTKWTDDEFEKEEKIKASINITILEDPGTNEFVANFSVQSERPVFNSSYSTILVNIVDKNISFSYIPNQTIENATSSYYDHLSAVLTMYAYTIIAYDYDSFSQFGGDEYFNTAQDIINSLPKGISESKSWDVDGKNNKGVMVKNMTNARFRPYRQAFYEYHRMGLDNMHEDVDRSKAVIVSALNTIKDVNQSQANSTALQMFADSKRSELVEIFKQSAKGQQKKVYDIMTQIDPSQASIYNVLK